MQLKMSFTIEKVLSDARMLVNRLKEHDGAADSLIAHGQTLYRRVDSMRQYQEDLNELNEIARHRPRANLIMGLVQENTQIRELQQENKELKACLEEHQSAIELIMSKYREQMVKLLMANKLDTSANQKQVAQEEIIQGNMTKICEMAAVMQKAIRIEESEAFRDKEQIARLETENKTLRELLMIGYDNSGELSKMDKNIQVGQSTVSGNPCRSSLNSSGNIDTDSLAMTDDEEHHFIANDMNTSVIENQSFKLDTFLTQQKTVQDRDSRSSKTSLSESVSSSDSSHNESAERISVSDIRFNLKASSPVGSCKDEGVLSKHEQQELPPTTKSNVSQPQQTSAKENSPSTESNVPLSNSTDNPESSELDETVVDATGLNNSSDEENDILTNHGDMDTTIKTETTSSLFENDVSDFSEDTGTLTRTKKTSNSEDDDEDELFDAETLKRHKNKSPRASSETSYSNGIQCNKTELKSDVNANTGDRSALKVSGVLGSTSDIGTSNSKVLAADMENNVKC